MNADGTDQQRLTHTPPAQDRGARLLPRRPAIAFASDRTGKFEIFLMNATGPTSTASPQGAAYTIDPTFFPQREQDRFRQGGTRIARHLHHAESTGAGSAG